MKIREILSQRLVHQQLVQNGSDSPQEIVQAMGVVQAQDFPGSKYAVGIRMREGTDQQIETAIRERTIIRTWLMRGTLQLVSSEDIRWMLDCFGPRIVRMCASRYQRLELDDAVFMQSHRVFEKVLQGGNELTREELSAALAEKGIQATGIRLAHIFQHAAYHQLICFGSRREKQHTFTLLDDCVPPAAPRTADEMVRELVIRYFTSRGPATLADFVWWSGLPLTAARKGIQHAAEKLVKEMIGGEDYWRGSQSAEQFPKDTTLLVPAFDEYILAYRDRSLFLDPAYSAEVITKNGLFKPAILQSGEVTGTWKKVLKKDTIEIEVIPFQKFSAADLEAIRDAAEVYGRYEEKRVVILS